MSFIARLQRAREILEQQGRLSTRALALELGGDELDELIEELVNVQQVARREGKILVWARGSATPSDLTIARAGDTAAPTHRAVGQIETRKVVTILFADLMGSTALQERLDPESVNRVMDAYYQAVRGPVEAAGGTVVQLLGDGVLCAFGIPRIAEDDALRAVRAAVGVQRAFREFLGTQQWLTVPIGLRVAVNTGEVVVSDEHPAGIGDPLNVAARLQQEACNGDVLIGAATERLVRERVTLERVGTFTLKGRAETVTAYRVVSLDRPAGIPATAFVGRDDELRRLTAVYDAAVAAPAARLAVILGSPGLGKSRLLDEFGRRADDRATVLRARCDAAGGATFAPVAEAVRGLLLHAAEAAPPPAQGVALGSGPAALSGLRPGQQGGDQQPQRGGQSIAGGNAPGSGGAAPDLPAAIAAVLSNDPDRDRITAGIAALLGGTPAPPEETFFVVRRFLAALAITRPVILAIDDLQWAEPLLLDLIEHLVQWGTGVPLVVLAAARPELRDTRSSLAAGRLVSDVLTLSGLDAAAATRLAADIVGADALPAAVAGRVLATSEGNPLFVGELVRMLVNDGALKREGDRWTAGVDLAALEMPPTIQALLAARIERLAAEERTVLERAAVIGRQFSRAAVAELLPAESRPHLDARLEALRRSELIEPDTTWFMGEPALRFHHGLTRDAAYRRVLKGTRAELHARFADWIETKVGDAIEQDETIGWHLEQAHQHLRELGPIDAQGRALGERASCYLAAAGRRALARDDLPVAADLLGRAIDRLDTADPTRADLALDWCEALLAAGDVGHARAAIEELGRFIGDAAFETPPGEGGSSGRTDGYSSHESTPARAEEAASSQRPSRSPYSLRAWHTCFTGQLAVLTDPQALHATAGAVAAAADELAAVGDGAGEAKAYLVHALALSRLGKVGACEAELDKALAAARRVDDRRRSNAVLANAPLAALWGPNPVTRASGRCLDVVRVLRITQGAPAVEAVALRCQAVLEALRGRSEAARRMIESSRRLVEELGMTQGLLETEMFAGLIALVEGDSSAAEVNLRAAYDGLRSHGLGIDAARAAALLAIALLAQDRAAEAEALSHESESLAGDDLQAAITWRRVRAEALARRGEHAAAIDFARAAVDIAAATDALLHHADARLALAAALRAAGRHDEAAAEEARAIELWETKGASVLTERARGGAEEALPRRLSDTEGGVVTHRRLRPNAATAAVAAADAAFARRDFDSIPPMFADAYEEVDHPTGSTYGRPGALDSVRRLSRSRDASYRVEPLAVLGDRLMVGRRRISARAAGRERFDVGEYENEAFILMEVDEHGRFRRHEVFADDRLGDAAVRLYERYAELLPAGHERDRAAAIARYVATYTGPVDLERMAPGFADDFEFVDRRPIGFGSMRGKPAFLQLVESLTQAAPDSAHRIDDVLVLRPDAMLLRLTNTGTDRSTGGPFERCLLRLAVFGADGRATRIEQFDPDREGDALARLDELVSRETPGRLARRVRANAATANAARLCAAVAARDSAALSTINAADLQVVHHPTHAVYGADDVLRGYRALIRARDGALAIELLAALGEALALYRHRASGSEAAVGELDVGAFEIDQIALAEVDGQGRARHVELFAEDHLADAIVRLYERHAELLPAGLERERIATVARASATMLGPLDFDRFFSLIAPDVRYVDHRMLVGLGPVHGIQEFRQALGTLFEAATEIVNQVEDILALSTEAVVLRVTNHGKDPAAGGAYERPFLALWTFGADGRLTHIELFEVSHELEAMARLDQLAGETRADLACTASSVAFANAATRLNQRFARAWVERDWDTIAVLHAPALQLEDRRRLLQMEVQAETNLEYLRVLFDVPRSAWTMTPIATRGERLALSRYLLEGDAAEGGGPLAIDYLGVDEVGSEGRFVSVVLFDPDDIDAAYAELDRRYDAGEGAVLEGAHTRFVQSVNSRNWDALAALCAPTLVEHDHRHITGLGTTRGLEAWVEQNARVWIDLAPDIFARFKHIRGCDRGLLCQLSLQGSRQGGPFEIAFAGVTELDAQRRIERIDVYDLDQLDAALARYAELTDRPPAFAARRVRPNAASANTLRINAALAARDADSLRALHCDDMRNVDHRTGAELDLNQVMEWWSLYFGDRDSTLRITPVATLGESLVLNHLTWSGSASNDALLAVGAFEGGSFDVVQTDTQGRVAMVEAFGPDRLGDAVARLYERYAEVLPEGPARTRATAIAGSVAATGNLSDLERFAAAIAPDVEAVDHRTVGYGTLHGAEAALATLRALLELSETAAFRTDDVLALNTGALLVRGTNAGTLRDGGGTFERAACVLMVFGGDGRIMRWEQFDAEREEEALARFDALTTQAVAQPCFANAATRFNERFVRAWDAHDWEAISAMHLETCQVDDRRRLLRLDAPAHQQLRSYFELPRNRWVVTSLATRGQRLALSRLLFEGEADEQGGAFAIDYLCIDEVDAAGRSAAIVVFDPNDLDAAHAELDARYATGEAAPYARTWDKWAAHTRAIVERDWEQLASLFTSDLVIEDHRPIGPLVVRSRDEYVASCRALLDLRPDARLRVKHVLALDHRRALTVVGWEGSGAEGTFAISAVVVTEYGADGLRRREDLYSLDQLDEARARFADLRPDPLRIRRTPRRGPATAI
jgi:class 3 adenylate cyclase/tetratricopeptide (TPR) repeat protein/ketosteroid isomerase-like protein